MRIKLEKKYHQLTAVFNEGFGNSPCNYQEIKWTLVWQNWMTSLPRCQKKKNTHKSGTGGKKEENN